jgi:hypothetical protein
MTRKFVLPFLLGIKFNLATLLPLILGAIILISKKAAFLSKLALFISGLFGLGGIASLGGIQDYGYAHNYGYGYRPGVFADAGAAALHQPHHHHQFASPYKVLETNTPRDPDISDDHFYDFEKKQLLKERSGRFYVERDFDTDKQQQPHTKYRSATTNQRNFVWQSSASGSS